MVRGDRTISSFIDVTLTREVDFLWDWCVSQEFNGSDHNSILFRVPDAPAGYKEVRPWKKADWPKFAAAMDKPFKPPEMMSKKKLDRLTQKLDKDCLLYTSPSPRDS